MGNIRVATTSPLSSLAQKHLLDCKWWCVIHVFWVVYSLQNRDFSQLDSC